MEEIKIRPSSIGMFLRCPQQWAIRYIDGIKTPPNGAMIVGTSAHHALETNFVQKVDTRKDLPADDIKDACADKFKETAKEVNWKKEEMNKEKTLDQLVRTVTYYHEVQSPLIQPKAVELPVTALIAGIEISGTLDLIDDKACLIDHKTSSKKVSAAPADYSIQASIYKKGADAAKIKIKKIRLDYLVKTQTPQVCLVEVPMNTIKTTEKVIHDMKKSIELGIFIPNPVGWHCSSVWCAFHPKATGIGKGKCKYGLGD